jgi:sulfatase maturation enzyme AslB (radical SAM superfamily)
MECIESTKGVVNTYTAIQKQLSDCYNINPAPVVTKQFVKQGNEFTNNVIEFNNINNRLFAYLLNITSDSIKNYTRTLDTFVKFNTNIFEQWLSVFKNSQGFSRP